MNNPFHTFLIHTYDAVCFVAKEDARCDPVANMLLDLAVSLYTLTLVHSTNPGGPIGIPFWRRWGWRAPRMPWQRQEEIEEADIEAQDVEEDRTWDFVY